MILYHKLAIEMVDKFEVIEADALATLAMTLAAMFQINSNDEVQLIHMRIKEELAHCS